MKINFTKKQYEDLLRLVYLGNWMANAHRVRNRIEKFNELESHIFSHAEDFGMERWADTDDPDTTYPTRYFEEESGVEELREEYDGEIFWNELSDRLGSRDFDKQYSKKELKAMDVEQRISLFYDAVGKWNEELENYGIDRLQVLDTEAEESEKKTT
jgi:hypothetical protein